jgi:hypothetical protein
MLIDQTMDHNHVERNGRPVKSVQGGKTVETSAEVLQDTGSWIRGFEMTKGTEEHVADAVASCSCPCTTTTLSPDNIDTTDEDLETI